MFCALRYLESSTVRAPDPSSKVSASVFAGRLAPVNDPFVSAWVLSWASASAGGAASSVIGHPASARIDRRAPPRGKRRRTRARNFIARILARHFGHSSGPFSYHPFGGHVECSLVRVIVLGSGSSGNALLVEAGGTRVLVDAGLGPRAIERRLWAFGDDLFPRRIDAIVATHEHS